MTDNSGALRRSRRHDSVTKRLRAAEALQAMIDTAEPITFPAVARRAGVSVTLLYGDADLAARLSDARARQQAAGRDRAWRLPARSLVTEQSLRADLANANEQVRRLREEVAVLRERLAQLLGDHADRASGRTASPLLDQLEDRVATLEAEDAQLRERISLLEAQLREEHETLEAARTMNRQLMSEMNRLEAPEGGPEDRRPTPTGRPKRSDRKPRSSV